MENEGFIQFESLKVLYGSINVLKLKEYLKMIYTDLSTSSNETRGLPKGVSKLVFCDFLKISLFISEKLFLSFDKNNDSLLDQNEFVNNLLKLYTGSFNETALIIFDLLDFNKQKLLYKSNIKLLLSHLPLAVDKKSYKYQIESLSEIDEIITKSFNNKETLSFEQFLEITKNKNSDIYFSILMFLYQNKPFNNDNIELMNIKQQPSSSQKQPPQQSTTSSNTKQNKHNNNCDKSISLDSSFDSNTKIKSPNRLSKLTPNMNYFRKVSENELRAGLPNKALSNINLRFGNEFTDEHVNGIINRKASNPTQKNKYLTLSKHANNKIKKQLSHSICDSKEEEFEKELNALPYDTSNKNIEQHNKQDQPIIYENYIHTYENSKLIKTYLVIVNNTVYYYKNEKKEEMLKAKNISQCFVKEKGEKTINNKKYYIFIALILNQSITYYCTSKEIRERFIDAFREAFHFKNFFEHYEIVKDIGEGNFGIVKLGVHKQTKEKVAIKIIKKDGLLSNRMERIKNEIDIMKICQHPNIVHLIDHFENADFIFIVMDYFQGGNLLEFNNKLKQTKTNAQYESIISDIMLQIAKGLQYLHSLGIVHRDLKPQNIMLLNDSTTDIQIKIMDFGLSKVIAQNEKLKEGMGTITYIAPEILIGSSYDFKVDVWSLGVTWFYVLSGHFPFDDNNSEINEEMFVNNAVNQELMFFKKEWDKYKKENVKLIAKCLVKEPEKRISVDEFIKKIKVK
jgi:tRNA A-37 threonylcarbamoyl transferase component Bud32